MLVVAKIAIICNLSKSCSGIWRPSFVVKKVLLFCAFVLILHCRSCAPGVSVCALRASVIINGVPTPNSEI